MNKAATLDMTEGKVIRVLLVLQFPFLSAICFNSFIML